MKARANPALIGGFVVGAIALATTAIVVLGSGRLFSDTVELVAFFPGSVNGLAVGAPVKFKGVVIGRVREIRIAVDEAAQLNFRIPVVFEIDPAKLTQRGASVTATDIRDKALLGDLIDSGLRAQLTPESFVTGVLYIELDIHPDTPAEMHIDGKSEWREIPTLPTTIERAASTLTQILDKIEDLDLDGLFNSLTTTIDEVNKVLGSPEVENVFGNLNKVLATADEASVSVRDLARSTRGSIDDISRSAQRTLDDATVTLSRLDDTLVEVRGALSSVSGLVESESPVVFQIGETLQALTDAARSLRRLADSIERNPSTLMFGRTEEATP